MRFPWAFLILLAIAPLSAQTASNSKKPAKKAATAAQTLTGCVDEKQSQFVLRTDDSLRELATLEPVGFDATNFARFVGHKVEAKGQLAKTAEGAPVLRVSSIEHIRNISDTCAPPAEGGAVTK
jgi:hypothetical protein